ncbi:MAG: acetyl-CoA hydrolase/transferase C-terminal domain-containing protein [Syntrophomonadaceae bacterium]|nr:acetyl-CoA hydrolase/transferase C-terminal domain-containing protein [Syntrophomonadaceae bacterium]
MFESEYKQKLRTPDEAVEVIKSGDWVDYMMFNAYPKALDIALAKRKEELFGVHIRSGLSLPPLPEVLQCDPTMEHFRNDSWHFGAFDAQLADQGICSYLPVLYHEIPGYYRKHEVEVDIAMMRVCPMDKYGYFNFGINASHCEAVLENSKISIVEENESMPYVYGGQGNQIHISEIDYIVRGENEPMANTPVLEASAVEKKIANHLIKDIHDGCCIQLGIGKLPNYLGKQIARSGIKDLGVHTEMMVDAYMEMWENGCINGVRKELDRKKMVCAFALGSPKLYEFMDRNPMIACYSVDYTNNPYIISRISNMISINACLEVDFYGQVNSEMQGNRQLTGTGGQWDFVYGAYKSNGGKSFLCMPSTFKAKDGSTVSKIRPVLTPGAACSESRQFAHYIVTEYGMALMKCQSIWQRVENLINIAHPDFRDELIKDAGKMGLWKKTNKIRQ